MIKKHRVLLRFLLYIGIFLIFGMPVFTANAQDIGGFSGEENNDVFTTTGSGEDTEMGEDVLDEGIDSEEGEILGASMEDMSADNGSGVLSTREVSQDTVSTEAVEDDILTEDEGDAALVDAGPGPGNDLFSSEVEGKVIEEEDLEDIEEYDARDKQVKLLEGGTPEEVYSSRMSEAVSTEATEDGDIQEEEVTEAGEDISIQKPAGDPNAELVVSQGETSDNPEVPVTGAETKKEKNAETPKKRVTIKDDMYYEMTPSVYAEIDEKVPLVIDNVNEVDLDSDVIGGDDSTEEEWEKEIDPGVYAEKEEDIELEFNDVNFTDPNVKEEYYEPVAQVFSSKDEMIPLTYNNVHFTDPTLDKDSVEAYMVRSKYFEKFGEAYVVNDSKNSEMGRPYKAASYTTEANADKAMKFKSLGTPYTIRTKTQQEAIDRGY